MTAPLQLQLSDYLDPTRWHWRLYDARGALLADQAVRVDPTSREYAAWLDLGAYLDYYSEVYSPEQQLIDLGIWIGAHFFGALRDVLWQQRRGTATPITVFVPPTAHDLLLRPWELACFADGARFVDAGLRFVYTVGEPPTPGRVRPQPPAEPAASVRVLAAFSLPVAANPLNLRRERYGLQQLVRELVQTRSRAVELRVLQYGATRATLQDALEEGAGWDIIHLSGHGAQGELLLEDERGGSDAINAAELGDLLDLARGRLKLLILDACYSGAGSHAAARVQLGLDRLPTRQEGAEGEALTATAPLTLPSLAQTLAARLACATLAMRYPVGDAFATELMLALYDKLLDRGQPLPAALHLALRDALATPIAKPPLSAVTPLLVGPTATTLQLTPPPRPSDGFALPTVGLGIAFPPEPPRLVGRLQPLLRASQALAPRSAKRGVFFYGMPGSGKTTCALELAYRHEQRRFVGYVWHRAPEGDREIADTLYNLLLDIEMQLNEPELGLTSALADPARFRGYTLPRLRALLHESALLLVLDNLEGLLTNSNQWRDPLWGEVIAALLSHEGPSRLILTAQRLPAALADHPRLLIEPIHALSFAESVLLAHELPHLCRLFDDEAGRSLLQATLRVVQGHPKLLELADGLATDRAALAARIAAAAAELTDRSNLLDAFFARGTTREGESRQDDAAFVDALHGWTAGVTALLPPVAGLLFTFLCRIEPDDRTGEIVEINWRDFLKRLVDEEHPAAPVATAALAAPEYDLPAALATLERAGLLAVSPPTFAPAQIAQLETLLAAEPADERPDLATVLAMLAQQGTTYPIHPGVAESVRAAADPALLASADIELGDYHIAGYRRGLQNELSGGGGQVVTSARRGVP